MPAPAAPDQSSHSGHAWHHPPAPRCCTPRQPTRGVLYRVVQTHLETFLHEAAARTGGLGLPRFIEREFRDLLACGLLERGFARFACTECGFERLVPFSCKGRICPSCGGRRMTERAAHLADAALPPVPVRQSVLTLPNRLRYLLAWNHTLCRAVLAVHVRALLAFMRRRARRSGIPGAQSGAVTVIQRFGSGLSLNVHFHSLLLDGVLTEGPDGAPPLSASATTR